LNLKKENIIAFAKNWQNWLFIGWVVFLIFLDILTKFLTDGVEHFVIIPWLWEVKSVHNSGMALGWLAGAGARWFLVSMTFVVLIALTWFAIANKQKTIIFFISMVLAMSGAYGNLACRLFYENGYVRDWIVSGFVFPWQTFVFNLADVFVIAGAIGLGIYFIFQFKFEDKKE